MINRIVEAQLASLEVAKGERDARTGEYFFPRFGRDAIAVGKTYDLSLSEACGKDKTLSSNWNGGRSVPRKVRASISKRMGRMLCLSFDGNELWVRESDIEEARETDGR